MTTEQTYERNEKIVKLFSIFSLVSLGGGLVAAIMGIILKSDYLLNTVAVYGLTLFVVPFLALQIAMFAGFHTYDIKNMGWLSVFFLVIFVFIDAWFFSGINVLYNIIPNFRLIEDRAMRAELRAESLKESWKYIGMIYVTLIGTGLTIRSFTKRTKNSKLMFA